jgi:hypothetical protein
LYLLSTVYLLCDIKPFFLPLDSDSNIAYTHRGLANRVQTSDKGFVYRLHVHKKPQKHVDDFIKFETTENWYSQITKRYVNMKI